MINLGKILVGLGLGCIVLGLIFMFGPRLPWLGKLPGDIHIQRRNFSFYFPLASCILFSIILSLIIWLFTRR